MRKLILALALLSLAGCGSLPSLSANSDASCSSTPGLIGGLAGAALGAMVGNQFGESSGKTLATGAGAVAGGGLGYLGGNAVSSCS